MWVVEILRGDNLNLFIYKFQILYCKIVSCVCVILFAMDFFPFDELIFCYKESRLYITKLKILYKLFI